MRVTKEEMETIITFDESTSDAQVYTYNKRIQNKLDRLVKSHNEFRFVGSCVSGAKTYMIPKKRVGITSPRTATAEQKAAMRERGKLLANTSL